MKTKILIAVSVALMTTTVALASINGVEDSIMQRLQQGTVLEFPAGSDIPLTIGVDGDVLETRRDETVMLAVKKKFWLKLKNNEMQMSFDGVSYKNLQSLVGGSISVGVNQDGKAEVRLHNLVK